MCVPSLLHCLREGHTMQPWLSCLCPPLWDEICHYPRLPLFGSLETCTSSLITSFALKRFCFNYICTWVFLLFYSVLRIKPKGSHMLGQTRLRSVPSLWNFEIGSCYVTTKLGWNSLYIPCWPWISIVPSESEAKVQGLQAYVTKPVF